MRARAWGGALLIFMLSAVPAASQQESESSSAGARWSRPLEVYVVPFGGLPTVSGIPGVQQSLGAHLVWPTGGRLALSGRYELRWTSRSQLYDAASLDVVGRIVGGDDAGGSITGGWARWDGTDYATVGARINWPFVPVPPETFPVVQGWFDLRYAAGTAAELYALDGATWITLMLAFVLPTRIGRR